MRGSWRPNRTETYWPPLLWLQQHFFPVLLGCSTWGLGAQPLRDMVLVPASSPQLIWTSTAQSGVLRASSAGCWFSLHYLISNSSDLQLILTSCRWGYIIIWCPIFFLRASQFRTQFNPSTVKVISWYSSTGCICYLHRSYFDSLARVNMLHSQKSKTRAMSDLDMTLSNLMVRLQSWSFEELGVHLHCHCSQVYSSP